MKSEFSEFSYGYAVLDELINWYGSPLDSVPEFPTTVAEASLGYDARISADGFALFLQFKVSDCMVKRTAFEATRGHFDPPFYRMHLRRISKSRQHELLIELENDQHFVFYVAPGFHRMLELNNAYFSREIAAKSIWIRPSEIGGLPDTKDHHVSFKLPSNFVRYSEPKHLQGEYTIKSLITSLQSREHDIERFVLTEQRIENLESRLLDLIRSHITGPEGWNIFPREISSTRNIGPIGRIAYLAHTFLDSEFLICRRK